ncbi:uncharacterized protein N7506_000799 [Penicillium brevicompactum]|uniref:uncharacterized protein n=1 Tax=Penicillium brevicompactum TaxID=5074 RepID=UPI00253F6B76|nr:uncharacterized protein N7506_000799 [Penicillium brevicompactum]KAJ5347546.1 hypothetical protein N7506_000799 [Penicillium brevicompactum]
MWSEAKQKTGFGGLLVCIRGTTRLSANWMRWQIVRGKRRLLWETNTDILSRWAQSVIETEILLREVTQHESFVKECIQIVNANHDPVVKAILPDMVEELITLDHEYDRLERTYETIVAGCPAGPIKSGYLWIRTRDSLVLFPTPSSDPNDPLNWSKARKALNFTLVSFFVLWTFVQLDIGFTAWGPMQTELGFSVDILNAEAAVNYGGLAVGCIFFMPLVHKYGRRPIYIFSVALQLAACIWQAKTYSVGDLIGSGLISGIGGAISEIVVQITIADMFFVHEHATMNGWYVIVQSTGAFLGPVASGYITVSQGWRWTWWWCVIFFGVTLVCVIVLFEESKYIPVLDSRDATATEDMAESSQSTKHGDCVDKKTAIEKADRVPTNSEIRPKTYFQRMAWVTPTDEALWPHFYQPIVVLFTFPAVSYAAITYGSTLCWFAIMTSLQASYMILPPYNFDAIGVGLMNIAPFVGAVLGFPFGGHLSDKSILWLSKRNGGFYEPEMRLWLALPLAIVTPVGILMFGLGLAYIIGDALVGVIFMRNILSVIVLFVLTPWVNRMGMRDLHILVAVIAFIILLMPIPLLKWGKQARIATASRYRKMAANQLSHRTV